MRIVELRDGTKMHKDVVDRCMRELSRYGISYHVAMQIISTNVIEFAKEGIDDFACAYFTETDIEDVVSHSTNLVADFYELETKGLLKTFDSFQNQDNETEYQFTVNAVFCKIIKNAVTIETNAYGPDRLAWVSPYRNPDLIVSQPKEWEYSR